MTTTKLTDRPVIAIRPLGISLRGTGLSFPVSLPVLPIRGRDERPTQAPAVAAMVKAGSAYAFAAAANGAGTGTAEAKGGSAANGKGASAANGRVNEQQKTQHSTKWAFRGLQPWSDPA
jgi:hypothetical protein